MKSKLLFIALLSYAESIGQLRGSLEQLNYFSKGQNFSMGPIASLMTSNNWYIEGRYNYEEEKTFSLYVGRAYAKEGTFSYAIVPMAGGVAGRFKGGSMGLTVDLEFNDFFFWTQGQFTFSATNETKKNFYFTWSELGYHATEWLFAGVAMQHTYYPKTKDGVLDPGFIIGVAYKRWRFPLYGFNPFGNNSTFISSIVWTWGE